MGLADNVIAVHCIVQCVLAGTYEHGARGFLTTRHAHPSRDQQVIQ